MRNLHISRQIATYFLLAGVFFLLSFLSIYLIHRYVGESRILLDSRLLSPKVAAGLITLLILYYLTDGLRLHCVIRAMGHQVSFRYIMKLVFVNIFVSNVTPLATGGGVVQVYFLSKRNVPIGEGTAATSIRTIIAALILFTLTPVIVFLEPNLFDLFYSRNVTFYIAGFSSLYLAAICMILFRIRTFKALLYFSMRFFQSRGLLSRRRLGTLFLRFSRELVRFSDGFRRFLTGPPLYVAGAFLFTCLFLLALFSFSIVLIKALQYDVPALTILAFQVVVTFFMYFAPTPGAAGVAEGGYVLLFSRIVSRPDITLLTISWRFLTIYIGVLAGILITYREVFRVRVEKPQ